MMKHYLKLIAFSLIISYPMFLLVTTNFFSVFKEVRILKDRCSDEIVYSGNPFLLSLFCSVAISLLFASIIKFIEKYCS